MDNFQDLLKRIEKIEFKQNLLFYNDEISRTIFEYDFSKEEYDELMNLLDAYRVKIRNGVTKDINFSSFERDMYKIFPRYQGNYHMCEAILYSMKEAGRWEEVFDAIYGYTDKYKTLREK